MRDRYNREIDYLRISITDRCNLRCVYCMPEDGIPVMKHEEILRYEEIEKLCNIFADLGIHKIKITGGEPLVRKDCHKLIENLNKIKGIDSITMTTNGVLLEKSIDKLVKAGLKAVNISLDSMEPVTYQKITRTDSWKDTMAGIRACLKYPELSVKINTVAFKGLKDEEILKIAELAKEHRIHIRFIEIMPIGFGKNYQIMEEDEIRTTLEKKWGTLTPYEKNLGNGPAHYFQVKGFQGNIGFISATTHKFCDKCNRIRLTSDGFLKTCLQYDGGCDLKRLLRMGADDGEIKSAISEALLQKPGSHRFEDKTLNDKGIKDEEQKNMASIGG